MNHGVFAPENADLRSLRPTPGLLICLFTVQHGENEYRGFVDSKDYAIIANPQLSVRLKCSLQGFRVVLRSVNEPVFNCGPDSVSRSTVHFWKVAPFNLRVVKKLIAQSEPHTSVCDSADSGS